MGLTHGVQKPGFTRILGCDAQIRKKTRGFIISRNNLLHPPRQIIENIVKYSVSTFRGLTHGTNTIAAALAITTIQQLKH
jgi:hypothetical protein